MAGSSLNSLCAAFQLQTQAWPDDVQAYIHQLSRPIWPA